MESPGYMLELQLAERLVVIVGGGRTARRKLPALLEAGARVKVIDPAPLPELSPHPRLEHCPRRYRSVDLESASLVFAASNDPRVNAQVAADAAQRGTFCCRTDSATDSDFSVPASLRQPPLCIAVSSSGQSPAMAAVLRDRLAAMIPASWSTATTLAAAIRRKVLTGPRRIPYNQQVLLNLLDKGLLDLLERSDSDGVNRLLVEQFGADFSLHDLQFSLPEGTP